MSTEISWTWIHVNDFVLVGESWNVIIGCREAGPGCLNCYARERSSTRLTAAAKALIRQGKNPGRLGRYLEVIDPDKGGWNGKVLVLEEALSDPIHWQKPRGIFVTAMGDPTHGALSFESLAVVWDIMQRADWHIYQFLTKWPARLHEFLAWYKTSWQEGGDAPSQFPKGYEHIWIGTSVENNWAAKLRIPALAAIDSPVKFISGEPLLEETDFLLDRYKINQLILGGESIGGTKKLQDIRECRHSWLQNGAQQAIDTNTRLFVKQLGSKFIWDLEAKPSRTRNTGKRAIVSEFPPDLRIQEYPDFTANQALLERIEVIQKRRREA